MCLFGGDRPDHELNRGTHLGFTWVVMHNGLGFRCGYVRVPAGHPWHDRGNDALGDVDIHGGVTFTETEVGACDCEGGGYWVGFDCSHAGDKPDPTLPGAISALYGWMSGEVRTQEYVEDQCRQLCEQAHAAMSPKVPSEVSERSEETSELTIPAAARRQRRFNLERPSSRPLKSAEQATRSSKVVERRRRLCIEPFPSSEQEIA